MKPFPPFVAQIFNLLDRRIVFCGPLKISQRALASSALPIANRRYGRLKTCAAPPPHTLDLVPQCGISRRDAIGAARLRRGHSASIASLRFDSACHWTFARGAQAILISLFCATMLARATNFTVTKTTDSGSGTLREKIGQANADTSLGPHTIAFNLSGGAGFKTITLLSPLPDITNSVFIDGWSQGGVGYSGPPLIELTSSGPSEYGLAFRTGNSTVRGLILNRFFFGGILLEGAGFSKIQGCYIGTDATGMVQRSNPNDGEGIIINSAFNMIGGTNASERNVLSGNFHGIILYSGFAHHNLIQGNYIGLNAVGTAMVSNRYQGIYINAPTFATGASDNTIGGSDPGARNVISGNGFTGIRIATSNPTGPGFGPTRNRIIGNYIGTDVTGLLAVPNIGAGIDISNATANVLGGYLAGEGNVISGNIDDGINMWLGRSNLIDGNLIGPNATGTAVIGNLWGVAIYDSSFNVVGGIAGNVIGGNDKDGIQIGHGSHDNKIIHNFIGTDEGLQAQLPNLRDGVAIFDSTNNTVGGEIYEANHIIGNATNGISIRRGDLDAGSVSNLLRGNFIAENGHDGVLLSRGANANQILGNTIGAGTALAGTLLGGNLGHGIGVYDSTNNIIGGAAPEERNYISGNVSNGIFLGKGALDAGSVSNVLRGNRIGTTPLGNRHAGVFVQGDWNVIGGTNTGEGNVIFDNGTALQQRGHGIVIASGEHNPILGNLIWGNRGRGIDLGYDSFTVNDIGDGDTGANALQNYPVVTRVGFYPAQGFQKITWTLNSKPSRPYRIEYFTNSAPDASGFGEGQNLVWSETHTTDAKGFAEFTNSFSLQQKFLSVTATDLQEWNTSEFSPVDTDGDAIADAWETKGIDYDEDGDPDLTLTSANPMHKDIYVEIDAMAGRAPDPNNLSRVKSGSGQLDGFDNVPNSLVQNPDGKKGIKLHLEIDQKNLPFAPWTNQASLGLSNAFSLFDVLKSNFFGTISQQANTNALAGKRLVYRYCIFADQVETEGGRARDFVASDFYLVLGDGSSDPEGDFVPTSFMHEFGHTLGLGHGGITDQGADHVNYKPNYHSVMNYLWDDGSDDGPSFPWRMDFSRNAFATLNETNLDESIGLGGTPEHATHKVLVGPVRAGTNEFKVKTFLEAGPLDWNTNGTKVDMNVVRNLNFLCPTNGCDPLDEIPGDILIGSEDWSKLRYYFLDKMGSVPGHSLIQLTNDLNPATMDWLRNLGADVGIFQFNSATYTVSETGTVAVVTVMRTFDTAADVAVAFSTLNGSATNGLDYVPTNGVLTFIGAESVKTFAVPILNDGVAEEPETIYLVLTNATGGATLGHRATATLTIQDDDPPGHFTVSNTNNSGLGSLRQALFEANASPGLAIVDFNIPGTSGLTISPSTALPTITNKLTIDGTTQPGFAGAPILELNGTSAGAGSDGLRISAGHCTVRGLVINRFLGSGINLLTRGENHIEGCYIGLNRLGTLDQGNAASGVFVQSPGNVIGGTDLSARNFISGNNSSGVNLTGSGTNQLLGNVIGLGVDGSDQGNSAAGVTISASSNLIGGEEDGARNVISGNDQDGVNIVAGADNRVLGNYIGTDLAGAAARGNGANGVKLATTRHHIGGEDPAAGNVISGNGQCGIELGAATACTILANRIGTDASGELPVPNQAGGVVFKFSSQNNQLGWPTANTNSAGEPFPANIVAFNNGPGVDFQSAFASNNVLRGNAIFAHSAFGFGIDLEGLGNRNQISPLLTSASNSISGTVITGTLSSRPNTNFTIDFYANATPGKSGFGEGQAWIGATNVTTDEFGEATFTVQSGAIYLKGRYMAATATDAAGNTSQFSPALETDVAFAGSTFTVGNTNDSGDGSLRQAILDANANVSERDTIAFDISGAGIHTIRPLSPLPAITDPVLIDGYTQPGASPNTAATGHNGVLLIELDGSLAGAAHGLRIESGKSIVRGLVINRFATNANPSELPGGIMLTGGGGNHIEGNFIGTDPTGFVDRGNAFRGVVIYRSSTNVIGGTVPAARNVISGNDVAGGVVSGEAVLVYGDGVLQFSGNRIEGNLLGTAADGVSALGNSGCGVRFNQASTNTTIGGTAPGAGNVIAFNSAGDPAQFACGVDDPLTYGARGIAILGNSIYSNFGPGIQGNRVNSYDGRGNFPLLASVISSNGETTVQGRLHSVSNATHRIEFFANDAFDSSGHGEGKTFLGAIYATTDTNGFAGFIAELPVAVSNTRFLTTTATDDQYNTSEFSPRLRVGDVLTNVIVVNSINDVDDGVANTNHTSLREAIMAANNHPGPDTIRFAIGSGARTIGLTNSLPALLDAGTTIDATTQPGFTNAPLIYLDGLFQSPVGFRLYAPSNTIRGFAINRFGYGIYGDALYASPFGGFNVIEGNYLGTDLTGSGSAGSQDYGIYFTSSFLPAGFPGNRIGGATTATRNVISGNIRAGIFAFGSADNTIAGNFIGTDRTGTNALGNGTGVQPIGGMFLQRCQNTVVGGAAPGAGNLISGNNSTLFHNQLFLWDDCTGSVVQGNYIGTDATGRTNLGPTLTGIDVVPYGGILIKSNLIVGFPAISLNGPTNRVEGNFMGTDLTGTHSFGLPSGLVIQSGGIGNIIGGTNAGSRNLISGVGHGITINGQSNIVQGNFIGTQIDGVSPLTNGGNGVLVQNSFNLIGGLGAGAGNTIAFSVGSGVFISAGVSNTVLGNAIYSNVGLGIDLGTAGVTANDFGDLDSGANNLQNFPILTTARNIGTATLLEGALNSRSNTQYRIEFFANSVCHPSGNGEGRTYLGGTAVATDGSGNVVFSYHHPVPISAGQFITATATDAGNNTSEFSPCVPVINDTNYVVLAFAGPNPATLSWPTAASSFVLERATNLTPPTFWQVISNGIFTNIGNNVFTITNDPTVTDQFFRLRKP